MIFFFSVDGKTLLDKVSHMHSITEDDIAGFIRQICEILNEWHTKNVVHLDLRVSRNLPILIFCWARGLMVWYYRWGIRILRSGVNSPASAKDHAMNVDIGQVNLTTVAVAFSQTSAIGRDLCHLVYT